MRLQWRGLRNPGRRWSPPPFAFTVLLVSLCLSCYASLTLFERSTPQSAASYLALSLAGLKHGSYWQFLTFLFPSPSVWQLLASLLPLYIAGSELESIVGPRHTAGAFLATLFPASAAALFWPTTIGQMGVWPAACGLMATLATVLPMMELRWRLGRHSVCVPLRPAVILSLCVIFYASFVSWLPGNAPITVPLAVVAGYLYARLMGYGFPSAPEIYFQQRQRLRNRRALLSSSDFIEQEVDPILEKIGRSGMASLTRVEKKTLRESAERLSRD